MMSYMVATKGKDMAHSQENASSPSEVKAIDIDFSTSARFDCTGCCSKNPEKQDKRMSLRMRIRTSVSDRLARRIACLKWQGGNNSKPSANNSSNEGVIYNNFYLNTYNGSLDLSGHTSGSDKNPTSSGNELLGTLGTLAGTLLMDQNTEETTNLSDRIKTQTLAMTAINTQSSVGILRAYSKAPEGSHPSSCSDISTDKTPATERFFTFPLATWESTTPSFAYQTFTPFLRLMDDPNMFASTSKRHFLHKTGWSVQVQCNASQFHAGSLLVCMIPEMLKGKPRTPNAAYELLNAGEDVTTWTTPVDESLLQKPVLVENGTKKTWPYGEFSQNPHQWTLYPHQILNLRTGTSVSLEVPYLNVAPSSAVGVHNTWTLLVAVLTPLKYATGVSPTIDITVSVAPREPVWNGIRHATMETQSPVPTAPRENAGMFVTTLPDCTTPAYGHAVNPDRSFLCGEVTDFVQIAQMPTFLRISPNICYFSCNNTINRDEAVFEMNVIPSDQMIFPTALGRTCQLFTQYTGSLVVSFIFTGAAMVKGKFLLAYTPPGAGKPLTLSQAKQAITAVWDIGLNSTFRFNVPYISPTNYRWTYSGVGSVLDIDGWVTVFQLTPLTYPAGTPQNSDIVVSISAGPDFTLRNPMVALPAQTTDNAETGAPQQPGPAADFVAKPQDVKPLSQSNLKFYFDRSFFFRTLKNITPNHNGDFTNDQYCLLDPHYSIQKSQILYRHDDVVAFLVSFMASSPFTYYHGDLEITVSPQGTFEGKYKVVWYPSGASVSTAKLTTGGRPARLSEYTGTPIAVQYGKANTCSFTVPWTSPLSVAANFFDGFSTYNRDGANYGKLPGNNWGAIVVFTTVNVEVLFDVYVRFKNFKAWAPRPYRTLSLPAAQRSGRVRVPITDSPHATQKPYGHTLELDNYVDPPKPDITIDGDVELNPGPFQFQGPKKKEDGPSLAEALIKDFIANTKDITDNELKQLNSVIKKETTSKKKSKQEEKVDADMSAFHAFLEAEDPLETAVQGWQTLREIQSAWKKAKDLLTDSEFWYTIVTILAKLMITSAIYYHSPDKTTMFLLGLLSLIDCLSISSIKKKIIDRFSKFTSVPPPPLEIQEEESFLDKLKGFLKFQGPSDDVRDANNWFNLFKNIEWALKLVDKLKNWVLSWFEKSETGPKETLSTKMKDFSRHATAITEYRTQGGEIPAEAVQYMQEIFDLATQTGQTNIANLSSRFLVKRTNNRPRTEPVVVVLRGKPGAGKSVASQLLAQAVSKTLYGQQSVYSFPPDSDHFDGYTGQYSVIMDDLGQNPDGNDFSTFCQMVSTTNFIPSMASLEDKGMPFSSRFIVATTNHSRFNPPTISDINAVNRRIFLDLTVKPGSMCVDGEKLDLEAALDPIGPAIGPFSQDCEILHCTGLVFTVKQTGEEISLLDVLDLVVQKIKDKNCVQERLSSLVFESPPMPVTEYALQMMTLQTEELAALREEVEKLNADHIAFQNEKREMFKALAIFASFCLAIYSVHKLTGTIKHWFKSKQENDNTEKIVTEIQKLSLNKTDSDGVTSHFLDTPSVQAPYENKKLTKQVVKTLQVQAPTLEFETSVYMHATSRFDFFMPGEPKPRTQTCVLVADRLILVNNHCWTMDFEKFEVRGQTFLKCNCEAVHLTSQGISVDCVAVQLPPGPKFRNNVSKFISSKDPFPLRNTPVVGINADGPLFFTGNILRSPDVHEISTGPTAKLFIYRSQTYSGYCGSPLVANVRGAKKILGIHSAGAHGIAGGIHITRENLEVLIDYFRKTEEKVILQPQGAMEFTGKSTKVYTPRKTTLKQTIAYPIFKPAAAPAVLSTKDKRLNEGIDLDKQIFSKHIGDQTEYPEEFTLMARWYAHHIVTLIGKDNGPISVEDAIKGIINLDPMDKNTSPGLPYTLQGIRRTELLDFEKGEIIDKQCIERYNKLVSGDYSDHIFQTFLKDEVRPIEKVVEGKTRVIDVPSVEHVILGRQLLGKFCAKFHYNPGCDTGSAIGCDPDVHWTVFAQQLCQKKYVWDVDYSGFDSTHGSGMFKILAECFFTPENGFDPALKDYLMSLAFSRHAYGEDRYTLKGGLPSGCSATSVLNTILNNIIVRAALKMTYSNFDPEDVLVLAYGDDLLVASDYQLDFNKVKEKLQEKTMYRMTTATKTQDFPLVSTLADVQFLKRKFSPFSTVGFIFRPVMDVKNLETILSFYHVNHLEEKLDTVARLAFHLGYEEYERLFSPFKENGISVPAWWYLQREWENKFF